MGPEGAVNIIYRKQIEAAGDAEAQDAVRNQLIQTVREQINAYIAAGWSFLDDLIDPKDTRSVICRGLEIAESKKVERPWRKHGVLPV
jgi:acetyl-CoA carboxylase carboxyltransferase component